MSRSRGLLLGALLTLVLAGALAGVLELVARAVAPRPESLWAVEAEEAGRRVDRQRLRLVDIVRVSSVPGQIYELKPRMKGRFMGALYAANRQGMRDGVVTRQKPAGTFRIALLGDSHGFGWGVAVEDGFADRIESALDALSEEVTVEVLNCCVPGYNSALEAVALERALPFDPDLILVQYYDNDRHLPNFLLDLPDPPTSYLLDLLARGLASTPTTSPALTRPSLDGEPDSSVAEWKADPTRVPPRWAHMVGWEGVERAFARMAELAAEAEVPLLLLHYEEPNPGEFLADVDDEARAGFYAEDAPVRALAEAAGFDVIETALALAGRLRDTDRTMSDIILSEQDWHLNAEGHALLAEILVEHLLVEPQLEALLASGKRPAR